MGTIRDVWDGVDQLWQVARELDRAATISGELGSRDLDDVVKRANEAANIANAIVADLEDVQRRRANRQS